MKFKIILLIAATASLFATAQNEPNDWANSAKYKNANMNVMSPKAVFMGNSITEGWWNSDSLFFKKHNYVGRGISGQVTAQMLVRFRTDVIQLKPKYVVILAGTNDIAQNNGYVSIENIFNNIVSMSDLARTNGIEVVLCSVLPAHEYRWRMEIKPIELIKQLNAMMKEYSKQNDIIYVDYYSAMVDERQGLPEAYSGDGVHPTLAGYKVMEKMIVKALKTPAKK